MNSLISVIFIVLVAGYIAPLNGLAQAKKRAVPTSRPSAAAKWQEQDWQKWKMKFSIPPKWRFVEETSDDHPDKVNGHHKEERQFTREAKSSDPFPSIDLSITVTTWPGSTANIQGQTRMLRLTPEEIMNAEQGTPDSWEFAKLTDKKVEDTKYKEISGWKGVYTKFWLEADSKKRSSENVITLGWTGHRVFEGNIQRIWISIEGIRKELILLDKIIDSFGFQ